MKSTFKTFFSLLSLTGHFKFQAVLMTVLLTSTIVANAQTTPSPTFEQTVDYIVTNTKGRVMYPGALDSYSRVKGYTLKDVRIEKNGKIIFVTEQKHDYNDFTITFNIFDLVANTEYPEGIIAKDFLVHFNGLNVSSGYGIVYATQNDALKVARALRHLRTVCEKPENDLFSQPVIEEKRTLGKAETMAYITDIIGNLGQGSSVGDIDYYCGVQNNYSGNWKLEKASNFRYKQVSHTFTSSSYTIYATWNESANGTYFENISMNCHSGRVRKKDNTVFKKNITLKYDFDLSKFTSVEIKNNWLLKLFFEEGGVSNKTTSDDMLDVVFMYNDVSETRYTGAKYFVAIDISGISNENQQKLIKAFNHLKKLIQEEKKKAENDDPFGN
jgi:hypothetical protein